MQSIKLFSIAVFIFLIQPLDAQPIKKVLIEKFTSANCGNCPRATLILKEMETNQENIIWLSHHSNWIPDAMYVSDLDPIYSDYAGSAPRAAFDRVFFDDASRVAVGSGTWEQRLAQQLTEPAIADVEILGNFAANQATIRVNISFTEAPEAGNFHLSLFAVEDIVVGSGPGYDQSNYDNNNSNSPLYQQGQPIQNYEHLNVTRAIISDSWGTAGIIPNTPEVGTTYSFEYFYEVPQEFDINNMRIVAALHYYDENDLSKQYVINANDAYISSLLGVNTIQPNEVPTLESHPNPFSTQTFIEMTNIPQNVEVIAYSLDGRIIQPDYHIENNGIQIRANQLLSGIYMYEVISEDGKILGKGRWVVK